MIADDVMRAMSEPVLVLRTSKTIIPPEVYDESDPKTAFFFDFKGYIPRVTDIYGNDLALP